MPSAVERWTGLGWKDQGPVFLISSGHMGIHWVVMTFYVVMPFALDDLGLSVADYGLLGGIFHVSAAIAYLSSGPLVDFWGRKSLLLVVALILAGFGLSGIVSDPSFAVLTGLVILISAAASLWHPPALAYLAGRYPTAKGYAFSIHIEGASVADSLAPIVAGALIGWVYWKGAMLTGAVPALAVSVLIVLFLRRENGQNQDTGKGVQLREIVGDIGRMLTSAPTLFLCALSGCRNVVINGLYLFLPLYLLRELEFSEFGIGATMFAMQIGGFLATPAAGVASDRISRRSIMLGGFTISSAALIGILTLPGNAVFVTGIAAIGLVLFGLRPVVQSWAFDLNPHIGGSATSLLFGTQSAFSAIAAVIGGQIAEHWGLGSVFIMLAATMMTANILVFFMPRKNETA
ncbi:MAG: MFS transporter [Rhodospirillales bacterium]|nr:MFS transporter [Rhodospirillales bacterium]